MHAFTFFLFRYQVHSADNPFTFIRFWMQDCSTRIEVLHRVDAGAVICSALLLKTHMNRNTFISIGEESAGFSHNQTLTWILLIFSSWCVKITFATWNSSLHLGKPTPLFYHYNFNLVDILYANCCAFRTQYIQSCYNKSFGLFWAAVTSCKHNIDTTTCKVTVVNLLVSRCLHVQLIQRNIM